MDSRLSEDPRPEDPGRRVAIGPSFRREAMISLAMAAGWTIDEAAPTIVIVDLAELAEPVSEETRDGAAVLVIARPGEGAREAYAAGATHWLAHDFNREDFGATFAFAGRYARRLRHQPFETGRRASDPAAADDPIAAWIADHAGNGTATSAIVIALTRFEFVNAAFGRSTGDKLLNAAQARIEAWADEAFGAEAMVARRTGAEFVIAAAGSGDTIAASIDALDVALTTPFDAGGASINLGSRIGMASSAAGETPAMLIRRAQDALVGAAPATGANRAIPLDRLAADLHHALERDEIGVVFQPQATMAGTITGVEALARWEHPRFGPLGADRLFAAAERADLGIALSDHIQVLALTTAAAWPAALERLRVSINVTAADLARPGFVAAFLDRVTASGLARARVTVEIVETGLIGDLDRTAGMLARLRGAGCRIAIDDFGTGYSSLAYLKALPIDYLKIDRSLTRDITGSDRDRVIVRGIIAIARSLGLETIAEGVETEEERALLAHEGCDLYQGFLCSEAVGSEALFELHARSTS